MLVKIHVRLGWCIRWRIRSNKKYAIEITSIAYFYSRKYCFLWTLGGAQLVLFHLLTLTPTNFCFNAVNGIRQRTTLEPSCMPMIQQCFNAVNGIRRRTTPPRKLLRKLLDLVASFNAVNGIRRRTTIVRSILRDVVLKKFQCRKRH